MSKHELNISEVVRYFVDHISASAGSILVSLVRKAVDNSAK